MATNVFDAFAKAAKYAGPLAPVVIGAGYAASGAAVAYGLKNVSQMKKQKFAKGSGLITEPTVALIGEEGEDEFVAPAEQFVDFANSVFQPIVNNLLALMKTISSNVLTTSNAAIASTNVSNNVTSNESSSESQTNNLVQQVVILKQGLNEKIEDKTAEIKEILNEAVSSTFGAAAKGIYNHDQLINAVING